MLWVTSAIVKHATRCWIILIWSDRYGLLLELHVLTQAVHSMYPCSFFTAQYHSISAAVVSYCEHLTCSLNLIVETIQRSHPTSTLHDIINLSFNLQPVEFGEINQVLLHDQHYAVVMEIPAKEEGEEETAINLFGVLRS